MIGRTGRWIARGSPLAAALVLAGGSAGAHTFKGALDPSFGRDGLVATAVPSNALMTSMALQPDGKILAGGYIRPPGTAFQARSVLLRYDTSGRLDPTFGIGGRVEGKDWNGEPHAIALQPDGKIIEAGTVFRGGGSEAGWGLLLLRYESDGNPDPTFGSDGVVETPLESYDGGQADAVALQPDGKIVVAGWTFGGDMLLARYTVSGTLDRTFGTGGIVVTHIGARPWTLGSSVAIQPDGRIVVAGDAEDANVDVDFVLARYLPDGRLDPTFGSNGTVTTLLPGENWAGHLVLQPDGRIVLAGDTWPTNGDPYISVVRYTHDGGLDPSFGSQGVVRTTPSDAQWPHHPYLAAITLQPDGKVLAGGGSPSGYALMRLEPNGAPDPSFGNKGMIATEEPSDGAQIVGIAVQDDGRIVVGGNLVINGERSFAFARYLSGDSHFLAIGLRGPGVVRSSPYAIDCDPRCTSWFAAREQVRLTPMPHRGWVFSGWGKACAGMGRNCYLRMGTDKLVLAHFSRCEVPDVRGETLALAERAIHRAYCSVRKVRTASSRKVRKGRVLWQRPQPGTKLGAHGKLNLTVSAGPALGG